MITRSFLVLIAGLVSFACAPADGDDYPGFCWYVQLYPRFNVPGGFELATGVYINTVSAESATQFYRGEGEF